MLKKLSRTFRLNHVQRFRSFLLWSQVNMMDFLILLFSIHCNVVEKVNPPTKGCLLLETLVPLMQHPKTKFREEAVWAIGNILAGPATHVHAIVSFKQGLVLEYLEQTVNDPDVEVKKKITCY